MTFSPEVKDVLLVGFGAVGAISCKDSLILKRSGLACVTVVARSNYDIVAEYISRVRGTGIYLAGNLIVVSGALALGLVAILWRDLTHHPSSFAPLTVDAIRILLLKPHQVFNTVTSAADRPYAYVLVTTKAIPELIRTSDLLKPLFTAPYSDMYPQPTYVLLQNGLNVEVDLYEALMKLNKGNPKIISTALYIGTNLLENNVVEHSDFDRLTIGMYRRNDYTTTVNTPAETALLTDIGGILETGGTTVVIVPEIQCKKFSKNFWNVAFSSFATLTGYTLPAIFRPAPTGSSSDYTPYRSPRTADLITTHTMAAIEALLRELLALGHAMGFADSETGLPSSIVDQTIEGTARLHSSPDSTHRPSMLLDAERGQPIEVEAILGEVVRMAKQRNIDMPRVELLYALLLVVQNQILRKLEKRE